MNHDSDNLNERLNPMSDERLDQLLQLANPRLDRHRQRRLQRAVARTLVAESSSSLISLPFMSSLVGAVAAVCLTIIVGIYTTQSFLESRIENDNSVGVVASIRPHVEPNGEFISLPPIVSRFVFNERQARPNSRRKSALRSCIGAWRLGLVDSLHAGLDQGILLVSNSPLALRVTEDFIRRMDQAVAELRSSITNVNSLTRRNARKSFTAMREQSNDWQSFLLRLESRLMQNLRNPSPELNVASFRLLCRCGTVRSFPIILSQFNRSSVRADVVVAAVRLAKPKVLASLVSATDDVELKTQLMTCLLERGDDMSLDLFLELTAKQNLHRVAQASGARAKLPPVEQILNRLMSNRLSIARAAAITLSACDDAEITTELIRGCASPVHRQAAWMALTVRRDAIARQFVNRSTRDFRLMATINAAQHQWDRQMAMN